MPTTDTVPPRRTTSTAVSKAEGFPTASITTSGPRPAQASAERAGTQRPEVLAQRRLPLPAEPAVPAHDVERHDHAVAGPEPFDVRTDRLDHAHRLVPDRLPGRQRRLPGVEV